MKKIIALAALFLFAFCLDSELHAEKSPVYVYDIEGDASLTYKRIQQAVRTDTPCYESSILKTDVESNADINLKSKLGKHGEIQNQIKEVWGLCEAWARVHLK